MFSSVFCSVFLHAEPLLVHQCVCICFMLAANREGLGLLEDQGSEYYFIVLFICHMFSHMFSVILS